MNAQAFVPSVIARWNPLDNSPYVFLNDDVVKDSWKAYHVGNGLVDVPQSVYKETLPLSPADEQKVVEDFKKFAQVDNVIVMKRRRYKKMNSLADRLSVPVENIEQAVNNAPADVQNVITQLPVKSKRSIAAERRWAADNLQSAMNEAKNLPKDATEEQKMALAQSISEAMTKMLMKIL